MIISVIIPAYNSAAFIIECLNSCIRQDLSEGVFLEIIVVDDCSTDNTVEITNAYISTTNSHNATIRLLKNQKNSGPAFSRNHGLTVCQGDYIAFIDSDDYMYPDRLSKQLKYADRTNSLVIFGGLTEVNEYNQKIRDVVRPFPVESNVFWEMLVLDELHMLTSTVLLNRKVINEIGLFDEQLIHFEDYDFFARIFKRFDPVYVPTMIAYKRVFSNSMSYTISEDDFLSTRKIFFDLLVSRDNNLERYKRKYWSKQYFGLARVLQGKGLVKKAAKYYWLALNRGNVKAVLGLLLVLMPVTIQKKLAKRKWKK